MNNKRLSISLAATVCAVVINFGISFFLTPFVVDKLGSEAYGFATLANNFTNYAQVLTVALNSMAGRYITIAYHRGDIEEAKAYFSSTFFANVIICILMLIPATLCVLNLDRFININPEQVCDVKILFAIVFLGFGITLLYAAFSTSTFIANRKDLEAKRNIESHIIKAVVLFSTFALLEPHVYYIGIAALLSYLFLLCINIRYTKLLVPNLTITKQYFSSQKVNVLVKSGLWNSINRMGTILGDGLDLLITNMFLSSAVMGTLAIAKQIPSVISTLVSTVGGVFAPNYTIAYAKNNREELLNKIHQSMIILGILSNLCLTILISVGEYFFRLWVPSQDAVLLQQLSVITILGLAINGGLQCIFNIFTVTNKIRANALVTLGSNILNVLIVFALLKTTNLGIYAVAGVSTIITILRNIIFSIPYGAKCIHIRPSFFFKTVAINVIALIIGSCLGIVICRIVEPDTWIKLIVFATFLSIITVIINVMITTSIKEKRQIVLLIKKICVKKR